MRLYLVSTSGAGGALGGAPDIGYARRRSTERHSSITKEQRSCSISSFMVGAS
jgi:hypothetical protein